MEKRIATASVRTGRGNDIIGTSPLWLAANGRPYIASSNRAARRNAPGRPIICHFPIRRIGKSLNYSLFIIHYSFRVPGGAAAWGQAALLAGVAHTVRRYVRRPGVRPPYRRG